MLQRRAVQKLHGDKSLPLLFAYVINRADVRVIQCGCCLRFALKPCERPWVAGNSFGQEFQRNETMQPRVLSFVDHAHPTTTELLDDAVVRDGLADHLGGEGIWVAMVGLPRELVNRTQDTTVRWARSKIAQIAGVESHI